MIKKVRKKKSKVFKWFQEIKWTLYFGEHHWDKMPEVIFGNFADFFLQK
jgi:hypothetical protein